MNVAIADGPSALRGLVTAALTSVTRREPSSLPDGRLFTHPQNILCAEKKRSAPRKNRQRYFYSLEINNIVKALRGANHCLWSRVGKHNTLLGNSKIKKKKKRHSLWSLKRSGLLPRNHWVCGGGRGRGLNFGAAAMWDRFNTRSFTSRDSGELKLSLESVCQRFASLLLIPRKKIFKK